MKNYLLILCAIMISCSETTSSLDSKTKQDSFGLRSHESLLKYQKDKNIEGLAFAIFNNSETIWAECIGKSTYGFKINEETLFSIQSISKNFTALAVMIAVQEGLLNLDTPISQYLPSFKVNSCYGGSAEQTITLRILLSHTAGFTHEAPTGNNYDYRPCSCEDHFKSIKKTWLKFPAGTNYSYSNLGFDLAATIIAQKAGITFNDYLKMKIFIPLGMINTTTDDKEISENQNRTEGNIPYLKNKHYSIPLIGSGAVYTNLKDLIRYSQLLMNSGQIGSKTLIDRKYLFDMFKITRNNYGLGTYIDKNNNILYINHNGGGYGYSATLLWFPEFNLGSVILCNRPSNTFDFCFSLLDDYIKTMGLSKDTSIMTKFDTINGEYFKNESILDKPVLFSCTEDTIYKPEWSKYCGRYSIVYEGMEFKWYVKLAHFLGFGYQNINIKQKGPVLRLTGTFGESTLKALEPGLFFTNNNEALDIRFETPTFKNIRLQKRN